MADDIIVSVGEYKVFDSGVVISHDNKDILLEIKSLKIRIKFVTKADVAEHTAFLNYEENNTTLLVTLTNFNNSLGTGLTAPAKIGIINGSNLYFQFIVHFLSAGTRQFCYTLLTKKEE